MENKENKKNYGSTLCLPKTEFPMRGDLPNKEKVILEEIFENGLYQKLLEKNKGKKSFHLHDGPPYANGDIHMGHALNKVLKDTIVRYKTLKGFYAPYVPGFDTHGLPTEIKAIEKLKLDKDNISVDVFRDTCKEFASGYIEKQKEEFKRLGVLGDWENPYITYQKDMEKNQLDIFYEMYNNGYIYQGLKPVHWCTHCETALAEAEIEYKDVEGYSLYVKFPVLDAKGFFSEEDAYAVIWTTTPWTLPGNQAVIVGKDLTYNIIEVKKGDKKEKLILLDSLTEELMELFGYSKEDYKILKILKGELLDGIELKHPFMDRVSRIHLGSKQSIEVDTESGTGLVHCAPAYGKEDYVISTMYDDVNILVCVDSRGHQTEEAGKYAGMFYKKSNKEIVKDLEEAGLTLYVGKKEHSYPHCWRCKNPIIFRAAKQWFASVEGFREKALEEITKVKWYPSWGEKRIYKMVEDRNDWCISRQRTWGVPLPIIYCNKCGKPVITKETVEKVKNLVDEFGTNAWWTKDVKEIFGNIVCEECGNTEFIKEKDIMDVWFDSGSTHRSITKREGMPEIDLYLEGNDQYRGWFQSSLLTAVGSGEKAPYKEVITNGFVVDQNGNKMSKSLGNVVDPMDISNTYGTDILRLWVISSDYQSDISISDSIIKQIAENYRKIRNTSRYLLGSLNDFDPKKDMVKSNSLSKVDVWMMVKLNNLIKEVTESYDNYEFNKAYLAINDFIINYLSAFYLDITKDITYTYSKDSKERRSVQTVMWNIIYSLVVILAPITSYTAEEIWKHLRRGESEQVESVMLLDYPEIFKEFTDNASLKDEKDIDYLINIKEKVAKALEEKRAEKVIGSSLDAEIKIYLPKLDYKKIKEFEKLDILKQLFNVSYIYLFEESLEEGEVRCEVAKAHGEKCERCWTYVENLSNSEEFPGICERCLKTLE